MASFFNQFGFNKPLKGENKVPTIMENKTVKQVIHGDETIFDISDFENLKTNSRYKQIEVGDLNLPSGQIVCADPMYQELGMPQDWKVEAGQYPVSVYIGLDEEFEGRVAYAEITFSDEQIVLWEMSLVEETQLLSDQEKQMNGWYPVENGLGSFCDLSTWEKYKQRIKTFYKENPQGNFYLDILEPVFKASTDASTPSRGDDWANFEVCENENIVMFGSGWGDGLYPRYVAFDSEGKPVKMVTDFILLEDEEEEY